ncbi:DNA-binding response regulator [Chromatiales bacterium (ex Bugula neritina AB1)]|nr:DNA-binding response regulator [Chromatiales bacterium (ex Bugula neritina AB1)]
MNQRKILLVEDDPDLSELIALQLQDIMCESTRISNGREALDRASTEEFDMLILDIMLPEVDGLEICRTVRGQNSQIPILMLTAKSSELDRVLGLELGADDYMTKPFSTLELVARVKALLRRARFSEEPARAQKIITFNDLSVDTENRRAFIRGNEVELTPKEFDLLHHFIIHPGRVFSRMQLLDKVWGYSYEGYHHTVNSHINRLRTKIEKDPHNPEFILTRWGVGYEFATLE